MQRRKRLVRDMIVMGGTNVWYPTTPLSGNLPALWIKADAITGLADGDAVGTWIDSSAAGNTLTQGTAARKPTYRTSILNGKPIVRFVSASNHYLSKTPHTISPTAPATVFIVANRADASITVEGAIVTWVTGSGKGYTLRNKGLYYSPRFTINGVAHLDGRVPFISPNKFTISAWRWDTSHVIHFYTNGRNDGYTAGGADTNAGAAEFCIGSTSNVADAYGGDIAEIIIYNADLSDIDRNKVEKYLSIKYNLTIAPVLNSSTYLTTPCYDDASGQAVHPDVLDFGASPWNGKRYWMSMTPYTNSAAAVENPSILCSNDGSSWTVPVGLVNPIDAAPGGGAFNSDSCLVMSGDGLTMYCIYREYKAATNDNINMRSSTDGVTWSAQSTLLSSAAANGILSPSVIWDGAQFVMWAIDYSGAYPYKLTMRTCATIDGVWSAASDCTTPAYIGLKHVCVRLYGGVYYGMVMCVDDTIFNGNLFMSSADGIAWYFDPTYRIVPGATGAWDVTQIYRSSFVRGTTFDIWYSAYKQNGAAVWHVGRTEFVI